MSGRSVSHSDHAEETDKRPLGRVRVLESAEYVTGPYAGMILASMGADVLKVERPPRGDAFRTFGVKHNGVSAAWVSVNHGKRSVLLDLKSSKGRNAFLDLAAHADVLIQNWRPNVAASLDLHDDVIAARNPRLVRLLISGFGVTGPASELPAFDGLLQAKSGMMAAAVPGAAPESQPGFPVDKATALYGVQAVLAALLKRERTGRGSRIDLAMLDVAAHANFPDFMQDQVFIDSDVELQAARSNVLETLDGHIIVSPVTGAQLSRCLDAIGRRDWKDTLKAISHPTELANRFYDLLESETRKRPTDALLRAFEAHDVAATRVLSKQQHFADQQVLQSSLYETVDDARVGAVRRVRYPAVFDGRTLPSGILPPDPFPFDGGVVGWGPVLASGEHAVGGQ
jgi:crotonobetainyl-CoA:carnitine CoA-transferase CaiB-like acyl-CoA transferase